jgi:hypothetical protein
VTQLWRVRKTWLWRVFHLEGGSGRNYKTDKEKVLSGDKQKPGCMGPRPSAVALNKMFEITLNLEIQSALFRPMVIIVQFILVPNFITIESLAIWI